MEDLEQDPEELPMDEVLSEIRHMLTLQMSGKATPLPQDSFSETVQHTETAQKNPSVDYFLLTPAMRCDLPSDSELSQNVQRQTARVLNKLQQQTSPTDSLSPALINWLNENLPRIIEKAMDKHFQKQVR